MGKNHLRKWRHTRKRIEVILPFSHWVNSIERRSMFSQFVVITIEHQFIPSNIVSHLSKLLRSTASGQSFSLFRFFVTLTLSREDHNSERGRCAYSSKQRRSSIHRSVFRTIQERCSIEFANASKREVVDVQRMNLEMTRWSVTFCGNIGERINEDGRRGRAAPTDGISLLRREDIFNVSNKMKTLDVFSVNWSFISFNTRENKYSLANHRLEMNVNRQREIDEDWLTRRESELRICPTWFGLMMFNNRRRTANVDIQEKKRWTKETRKLKERIISIKPIRRRNCEDCQCSSIWGWGEGRRRCIQSWSIDRRISTKQFVRHWEILRRRTSNERHEHSVRSRERWDLPETETVIWWNKVHSVMFGEAFVNP